MYFPLAFRFLVVASACEFVSVTLTVAQRGVRGAIVHACVRVCHPATVCDFVSMRNALRCLWFLSMYSFLRKVIHKFMTKVHVSSLSRIKEFNPPSPKNSILPPLNLSQQRATARCLQTKAKRPTLIERFTLVNSFPF